MSTMRLSDLGPSKESIHVHERRARLNSKDSTHHHLRQLANPTYTAEPKHPVRCTLLHRNPQHPYPAIKHKVPEETSLRSYAPYLGTSVRMRLRLMLWRVLRVVIMQQRWGQYRRLRARHPSPLPCLRICTVRAAPLRRDLIQRRQRLCGARLLTRQHIMIRRQQGRGDTRIMHMFHTRVHLHHFLRHNSSSSSNNNNIRIKSKGKAHAGPVLRRLFGRIHPAERMHLHQVHQSLPRRLLPRGQAAMIDVTSSEVHLVDNDANIALPPALRTMVRPSLLPQRGTCA